MSFSDHPLVCRLLSHHYLPVLAVLPFLDKRVLFCFLTHRGIPIRIGWAFSLTNPYGMHLVILAHLSLFWVICHPNRTFPPKELKQELQNWVSPSPHCQTMPSFTSYPWPTTPVLAKHKWVMPELCACSTSMCVHGLSVVHVFAMT